MPIPLANRYPYKYRISHNLDTCTPCYSSFVSGLCGCWAGQMRIDKVDEVRFCVVLCAACTVAICKWCKEVSLLGMYVLFYQWKFFIKVAFEKFHFDCGVDHVLWVWNVTFIPLFSIAALWLYFSVTGLHPCWHYFTYSCFLFVGILFVICLVSWWLFLFILFL